MPDFEVVATYTDDQGFKRAHRWVAQGVQSAPVTVVTELGAAPGGGFVEADRAAAGSGEPGAPAYSPPLKMDDVDDASGQ